MRCLILLLLLFLCQSLTFLLISASPRAPTVLHKLSTNNTREILLYAKTAEIQNFMNKNEEPCSDFYNYACGNWAKINPATQAIKTGIFHALAKSYDRRVAHLLTAPKLSSESDMDRRVKYFYDSCMNLEDVRHNYRGKLLSIMEPFGGMPALQGDKWNEFDFNWLEVIAEILRKYGQQIIIGVDIAADLYNNQVNRLYIGEPEGLIPSHATEYYAGLLYQYQMDMQTVFGMSSKLASQTAEDMVSFMKSLAKGAYNPLDGVRFEDKSVKRTLEDMSDTYQPTLNLTSFVSNWLGYKYRLLVYEYVEPYLQNLKTVIEKTPTSTVANYIMWKLIDEFRLEAAQTEEKQKSKCIQATKVFFLKYLDNMVYRQLLENNEHVTNDVLQLWEELKETFAETLNGNSSNWLTPETREKALEKLTGMTLEINTYENEDFEDEFGDLVISTENFFDNVIALMELRGHNYRQKLIAAPKLDKPKALNFSPAYVVEFNKIFMPVSALQPHFLWDPIYPAALKYATMGYMIAHEMAHGFDDNSRGYDDKGNLTNWWDKNSAEEFLNRKDCLSKHYSKYKYSGKRLLRSSAQDENIADIVGIRVAFATYQKWLSQQSNSTLHHEQSFKSLNLTPQQLFFVATAQIWCADVNVMIRPVITKIDVHMPEEVRVAGMMSNLDEFAEEFQCSLKSAMNPEQKCVIY